MKTRWGFVLRIVLLAALLGSALGFQPVSVVSAGAVRQAGIGPYMLAHPRGQVVQFWDFSPDATITVTVYDSPGGALMFGPQDLATDPGGHALLDRSLQVGEYITASDPFLSITRELLVESIRVYSADAVTNVVSGVAVPGRTVELNIPGYAGSTVSDIAVDALGNWSFDYDGVGFDLLPEMRTSVEANLYDVDGDFTQDTFWNPPHIYIDLHNSTINLEVFEPNVTIPVQMYESEGGTLVWQQNITVNAYGNHHGVNTGSIDLQPGMYVRAQYGNGQEKTLVIHPLTVAPINAETDVVSGASEPHARLYVAIYNPEWHAMWVDADANGDWVADFTGEYDVPAGARGWARVYDADDDYTYTDAPFPHILACISCNNLNFWQFSSNDTLTLEIFDSAGGARIYGPQTVTTDDEGFGQRDYDIQPGQFVRATDDLTGVVKELTVVELAVSTVDPDTNVVTGRGPANGEISLVVVPYFSDSYTDRFTVNASGDWSYDFDDIGFDVTAQMLFDVEASAYDTDGDLTQAYMLAPPVLRVEEPSNTIVFYNATPSGTARIEIFANATDTQPVWEDEAVLTQDGFVYLYADTSHHLDLADGMRVRATDLSSGLARDLVVRNLSIQSADFDLDRVAGQAFPNAQLTLITSWPGHDPVFFQVIANASGAWSFDFSTVPLDITKLNRIYIQYYDPDGDVVRAWYARPVVWGQVAQDYIYINNFPALSSVRIRILDESSVLFSNFFQTSAAGILHLARERFNVNLLPGYTVEASQGTINKSVLLRPRSIDGMDITANTIWGKALPNETFTLRLNPFTMYQVYSATVTADANGDWLVDTDDNAYNFGYLDQQYFRAYFYESDDDLQYENLPDNYIITTMPDSDTIQLSGFDPSSAASVILQNGATVLWQGDVQTDLWGDARLAYDAHNVNLQPGMTVAVSQGVQHPQMTIAEVTVTGVDAAADTLSGVTAPNTPVFAILENPDTSIWGLEVQSEADGDWSMDFSEWIDVSSDTKIQAFIPDGDHRTEVTRPVYYALTTLVDPAGQGAVNVTPAPNGGSGSYFNGTLVHLDAISNPGYGFIGWSGANVADPLSPQTTLVMDGNKTVTATFAPCFALSLNVDPPSGGQIAASPAPNCGSGYNEGTEITLTASVFIGHTFVGWSGDLSGSLSSQSFVIDTNISVTAEFVSNTQITPAQVTLLSPANASTLPDLAALEWQALASTLNRPYRYEVQVSRSNTFTPLVDSALTDEAITTFPIALADGRHYWRVRAINQLGYAGAWSPVWSFTLDSTYTAVPVLISPANAAVVLGTPILRWKEASGAYRYMAQWSSTIDFSGAFASDELAITSFTPPTLDEATYYWRVRARDLAGNWGEYSAPRSFTVDLPIPKAPDLSAPSNKVFTNDPALDFAWGVPAYAHTYQLRLDNQSSFASPEISQDGLTSAVTTLDLSALTVGVYYWRVRALNDEGTPGPWSVTRSLTYDINAPAAPLLLAPVNNASVRGTPKFTWRAVTGAVHYILQLYTNLADPDASIVYTSSSLTTTSYTPPILDAPQVYGWRVRAVDAAGNLGFWSTTFNLTVVLPVPGVPLPHTPNAAALSNLNEIDFTWSETTYAETYELVVDDNSSFASPLLSVTGLTNSQHLANIATWLDGRYYWRVRAVNSYANSAWSSLRNFTLDRIAPAAVRLSSPANNADNVRANAIFSWVDIADADLYEFQAAGDVNFTSNIYTVETASNAHRLVGLQPGTVYWHVRARDKAGNWGAWSATPFMAGLIAPLPAKVIQTVPANKFSTNLVQPDFHWLAAEYADHYEIQLAKTTSFTGATLVFVEPPGLDFTPDNPLSAGTWYWRVRAVNIQGEKGLWSAVRSLSVDVAAPPAPALSVPGNGAVLATDTPVLNWGAVSGAIAYQIEVASDVDFEDLFVSIANLTGRSYTVPTLPGGTFYWRVRARDAAGNWSLWSAIRSFVTN